MSRWNLLLTCLLVALVAGPFLAGPGLAHPTLGDDHATEDAYARLSMHTDTYDRQPIHDSWHQVCFTLTNIHDSETLTLPYSDPWRIENETGVRMAGEFGWQAIFHYEPGESAGACWDMQRPVYTEEGHISHYEEADPGDYTLRFPFIIGYGTGSAESRTLTLAFTLVDETGMPWPLGP